MQDRGYGLPRTPLPGSSVNKGKKKGWGTTLRPSPAITTPLAQPQRTSAPSSAPGRYLSVTITRDGLRAAGHTRRCTIVAAICLHAHFCRTAIATRSAGPVAATRAHTALAAFDRLDATAFFPGVRAERFAPWSGIGRARTSGLGLPRCHTQPSCSQRARGGQLQRPAPRDGPVG